ncbi:Fe-S cluster assembly ATPase SufC [Candidatus Daviesbacteria bacterium]|nr:Fe-S cluster assembly ATPase SufC [Candidatus Daviesbacteria bacterium]
MKSNFEVKGLSVEVDPSSHEASTFAEAPVDKSARRGKRVVFGVNLTVKSGEVHALMGPNGSGKSSLALVLMGHPAYQAVSGSVELGGKNLLSLKPNERAKLGLFLSFQNPVAVPGVSLGQLIWSSYKSITGDGKADIREFYETVKKQAKNMGLKEEMLERFINDGFSGGEKKKAELLMLLSLQPKFVILDEIDSGLDVDTLKKAAEVVNQLVKKGTGVLLITHNQKILKYVKPNVVHVLKEGRIVKSGQVKLAREIEEKGYAGI